ncbi:hypothetical protein G3M53_42140, partial [Streptomyces sp. SID7982]|nr:hypothetical protein [Streptomyces sp. SID7982]
RISDQTNWEAPDPVWWTRQGYAVITPDLSKITVPIPAEFLSDTVPRW